MYRLKELLEIERQYDIVNKMLFNANYWEKTYFTIETKITGAHGYKTDFKYELFGDDKKEAVKLLKQMRLNLITKRDICLKIYLSEIGYNKIKNHD